MTKMGGEPNEYLNFCQLLHFANSSRLQQALTAGRIEERSVSFSALNTAHPHVLLSESQTQQWVDADARDFAALEDPDEREFAAIDITANVSASTQYREYFERVYPHLGGHVAILAKEADQRVLEKDFCGSPSVDNSCENPSEPIIVFEM